MSFNRRWILGALVLFAGLLALWVVPLLRQESPGTILQAAQLELRSTDLVDRHGDGNSLMVRSSDFDRIEDHLAELGYELGDQMGAGYIFEGAEDDRLLVVCRMYSTRFQICDLN